MSNAPPPRRRTESTEARDRRILQAARHCFATQGFERTTMGAVARAADVAVGTLYLRAATKEALLARVLEELEQELAMAMGAAAAPDLPWPDRFPAVFAALLRAASGMPDLPQLMRLAHHAAAGRPAGAGPIRRWIAGFITAGQAAGTLRPVDPDLAAAIAFGMVEGAMTAHAEDPRRGEAQVVAALTDLARRWLLA